MLLLSTPNILNISNIYALLNEVNIFWPLNDFYGSLDRYNRKYTPKEVREALLEGGFNINSMYGMNSYSNWRSDTGTYPYKVIDALGDDHPLLRNTLIAIACK